MKKFMSWLSISALLMSSLLLGMGSAVADYDDEDEERIEEGNGAGGAEGDQQEGAGAGGAEGDDEWEDDEDEWEDDQEDDWEDDDDEMTN